MFAQGRSVLPAARQPRRHAQLSTTFVYELYEQVAPPVVNGDWQSWDVDSGQFWSSRTVTTDTCAVVAGAGGAPFYTLAGLKAACPDAVVVGFGVNVGSNNPSYNVEADLVDFNGTTYDFQLAPTAPTTKDQCKNGGWATFTNRSSRTRATASASSPQAARTARTASPRSVRS